MDLKVIMAAWLVLLALLLRGTAGRPGGPLRWAWVGGLLAGFGGAVAAAFLEPTLLDAYVVGGLGALAAAGPEPRVRRAVGSAVAVLGLGLAAARGAGIFTELPPAGAGPVTLLVVLAAGVGALAALAARLLLLGPPRLVWLTAAALWVTAGLHQAGGLESGFWGVLAGLRVSDRAVFVFDLAGQTPSAERVMVSQGEVGLLLLTGALLLLALGPLPRWRRRLTAGGLLLATGALVLLWAQGVAPLVGTSAAVVEALASRGQALVPASLVGARLDLATVLPTLVAVAGGLGLAETGLGRAVSVREPAQDEPSELGLALVAGLLLTASLMAVWREVWGTPLWRERGALIAAMAVLALALRLRLGPGPRLAWLGGLSLWAGAALLAGAAAPTL